MGTFYLTYGVYMSLEKIRKICPSATVFLKCQLNHYRFLFRCCHQSAYPTIEKHRGSSVPVVVWEISEADARRLEYWYGKSCYKKKRLLLKLENTVQVCTFVMPKNQPGLPTDRCLNDILDSYEENGFDPEPVEQALKLSTRYAQNNGGDM